MSLANPHEQLRLFQPQPEDYLAYWRELRTTAQDNRDYAVSNIAGSILLEQLNVRALFRSVGGTE